MRRRCGCRGNGGSTRRSVSHLFVLLDVALDGRVLILGRKLPPVLEKLDLNVIVLLPARALDQLKVILVKLEEGVAGTVLVHPGKEDALALRHADRLREERNEGG